MCIHPSERRTGSSGSLADIVTDGRCTEVTRVTVVGIDHDALEHHLRVGHEDLERMKSGRADGQLHGEPAQVVEHFVTAELPGAGQSDARILTGERFRFGDFAKLAGVYSANSSLKP